MAVDYGFPLTYVGHAIPNFCTMSRLQEALKNPALNCLMLIARCNSENTLMCARRIVPMVEAGVGRYQYPVLVFRVLYERWVLGTLKTRHVTDVPNAKQSRERVNCISKNATYVFI